MLSLKKLSQKFCLNQLWIFQFPVVDSAENIPPRRIRNFVNEILSAKFFTLELELEIY